METQVTELGSQMASSEIQAVSRAAQILGLFGPERPQLTVSECAQILQLNRSTVNRYFLSLETAGMLQRCLEPNTAFEPSRLLYQIGAFALGRQRVTEIAPATMRELAAESRLTIALSLWGTAGPVVVHVEQHDSWGARVSVRVGFQLPINAAQSQIFCAFLSDRLMIDRIVAPMPEQQRNELTTRVANVRESGLAYATTPAGIRAVAAPVFDAQGLCASIAMIGTATTLSEGRAGREEALLSETAQRLTLAMGGLWPTTIANIDH